MTDWDRWAPRFAEALDPNLYTLDYLTALVGMMKAQVWFGADAAIVTEIRTYPTGARVIHGLVAAVDPGSAPGAGLREIVEVLVPRAEAWARSIGCILAIVESRPAWVRVLKQYGYEPHQQAVRKEL